MPLKPASVALVLLTCSCETNELVNVEVPFLIATTFKDGAAVVSGSPGVSGMTGAFDLSMFDSVKIAFTTSFSVFPPPDFDAGYNTFVRRHEPPSDLFYSVAPGAAIQEHELVLKTSEMSGRTSVSFDIGAESHSPAGDVQVTVSHLSLYAWQR